MAYSWHKVSKIYKSYSVQVAKKKKKNLIHLKIPFSYAASTTFLIYNTCNLQATLFLSVNHIDFTITICSLKPQNYV